jgi:hypothetical protein
MDILQTSISTIPVTQNVLYSCVLTNNWTMENHPVDYPSGSAHWSPPVMVTHNKNYEVWAPNKLATPGVEFVAETGSTSILQDEVRDAQSQNATGDIIIGTTQFLSDDPTQSFEPILMTANYPYLSTISMIAPSPDWFTGVYNFLPVGASGGGCFWFQSFEIATYPWDAGTEKGEFYSINNDPEDPHEPIFQLTNNTVPDNGVFLDSTGTDVLPVAIWKCSIDDSEISSGDGNGARGLRGRRA